MAHKADDLQTSAGVGMLRSGLLSLNNTLCAMRPFFYLLLSAVLILPSCKKCDKDGLTSLAGTWQEQEEVPQFAGSTYRIAFTDGSHFQLRKALFTDAIDPNNPCSNSRSLYVSGFYTVSGNLLTLRGGFYDSSYTTAVNDCRYGTSFEEQHTLSGSGNTLVLDNERGEYYRIILQREQ
jgi:hypothetical protein